MWSIWLQAAQPLDPFVKIVLFLVALVLIWVALKFLLRLAIKIFTCGCAVIVLIGAVLILLQVLAQRGGP